MSLHGSPIPCQVVLFHDVPLERNMQKLMGVTGQIEDFRYDEPLDTRKVLCGLSAEAPGLLAGVPGQRLLPADSPGAGGRAEGEPLRRGLRAVEGRGPRASHLGALARVGGAVPCLVVFMAGGGSTQDLVLATLALLRRYDLVPQVYAWGSPERSTVQA